ncbi:hypothetical protein EBR21_06925 [bacterium]|nr:hypothetical protein [bacterium]
MKSAIGLLVGFSVLLVVACGAENYNSDPAVSLTGGQIESGVDLSSKASAKAQEKAAQKPAKGSSQSGGKSSGAEDEDDEDDEDSSSGGSQPQPPAPTPQPPAPTPQPPAPTPQPPAPTPQPPTVDPLVKLQSDYTNGMKALIDSRCQTCHAGRTSNFKDFAAVKQWSSQMSSWVSSGKMPIGSALTATEKSGLLSFLDALKVLP